MIAGIDIGGTKSAACITDDSGRIIAQATTPTDTSSPEAIIRGAQDMVDSLVSQGGHTLQAIGVCTPGQVLDTGLVMTRYNLHGGVRPLPIAAALRERFGLPVFIDNDANAALLGEYWFGAAQGAKNALYVTVSTGIGAALLVNGSVFRGARNRAGEIAHLSVAPLDGRLCKCGARGCIEAMASGTAIASIAQEALAAGEESVLRSLDQHGVTARDVLTAAKAADPLSKRIIDRVGFHLGAVLAGVASLLDPELIVLGGGVMNAGPIIWDPVEAQYLQHEAVSKEVPLIPAVLRHGSVALGAAALALQALSDTKSGAQVSDA